MNKKTEKKQEEAKGTKKTYQINLYKICDLLFIVYYQNVDIGHMIPLLIRYHFFVKYIYDYHTILTNGFPYFFLEKLWENMLRIKKAALHQQNRSFY